MNKFITATALALMLGACTTVAKEPSAPLPIQLNLLDFQGEKIAVAEDESHFVAVTLGYKNGEKNCSKLYIDVISFFPLTDKRGREIIFKSTWQVDDNSETRLEFPGKLLDDDQLDIYNFGFYPYPESIMSLMQGKYLKYQDQSYTDGKKTIIDLTNFKSKVNEIIKDCLNRGGKFERFLGDSAPTTRA